MSETDANAPEPVKRVLQREIEIDAPVEEVWRALTDARELARWFPLEARVVPGVGGKIFMSWGPEFESESPIVAWEENKRLSSEGPALIEWTLEARGGKTLLRLVQSGFASGAAWEDEFWDSTAFGWGFMLANLRYALERHRNEPRLVAWPRIKSTISRAEAYRKLTAPGALFTQSVDGLPDHAPYQLTTVSGETISGEVEFIHAPRGFCLRVAEWNDALLWATIEGPSGELEVQLWLSAFGLPAAVVAEWEQVWRRKLEQIFSSSTFN
jgi:uncharacterized protein YndB with AHSA1/START domain